MRGQMTPSPDLDPDEAAVTVALSEVIRREIASAGGALSFERFMDLALFAPALGYYVGGAHKFGAAGDFLTAPEISPLFGACIARQCGPVLRDLGGSVLEFGGGSGRLAASILAELRELDGLPERYFILELSPELRLRQRAFLEAFDPALAARVAWVTRQPVPALDGIVIANEVLDSLPVRNFRLERGAVFERCVTADAGGRFTWYDVPASADLAGAVWERCGESARQWPAPYRSEINFRQRTWIADLARSLRRGVALVADYGYPRHEYYHADRSDGTLQCHFRHRAHNDPLILPGLQDITASVDFTAVAESASDAGFAVLGFADQASFLLSCGMTELLARDAAGPLEQARRAVQAKRLLLPAEMGTRCKFIALGKDYPGPLSGFQLRDDRHRL